MCYSNSTVYRWLWLSKSVTLQVIIVTCAAAFSVVCCMKQLHDGAGRGLLMVI